jgi:hypothetical protein
VHFHEGNSDLRQNCSPKDENSLRQEESLSRLRYMIAFLIEKNEQMRQQLSAESHEERL